MTKTKEKKTDFMVNVNAAIGDIIDLMQHQAKAAAEREHTAEREAEAAKLIVAGYNAGHVSEAAYRFTAEVLLPWKEDADGNRWPDIDVAELAKGKSGLHRDIHSGATSVADKAAKMAAGKGASADRLKALSSQFRAGIMDAVWEICGGKPGPSDDGKMRKTKIYRQAFAGLYMFAGEDLFESVCMYVDLARREAAGELRGQDNEDLQQLRMHFYTMQNALHAWRKDYPDQTPEA